MGFVLRSQTPKISLDSLNDLAELPSVYNQTGVMSDLPFVCLGKYFNEHL